MRINTNKGNGQGKETKREEIHALGPSLGQHYNLFWSLNAGHRTNISQKVLPTAASLTCACDMLSYSVSLQIQESQVG